MKKIYKNWRDDVLNEFAPSYNIEDEEAGIEQYMTPVSDLVQNSVQAVIDINKSYHASGRPIDPKLLQGLLQENDIKEIIDSMQGSLENDYLRKLNLHPGFFEFTSGHISYLRSFFNMAEKSRGKTFLTDRNGLQAYMESSLFMKEKQFIQYRENISNATEALGHFLRSKRYEIIHSIRLFTGESVSTVRSPSKFKSELSRPMESDADNKKATLTALLPSFTVYSDSIDYEVNKVFDALTHHVNYVWPHLRVGTLKRATSEKGKKLFTAYFDELIEIGKSEEKQKELNINTFKKQEIKKMIQSVDFSTKSRKYQELMMSFDRIRTMLPHYDLFIKYYKKFLGFPTQDDYEKAGVVLRALSKKKVKGDYLVYRGMYLKGEGGADLMPKERSKILEGMEFDFYDISSWSTDRRTALGFIESDGAGEGLKILFSMKPKRGTYIDYYSAFEGEKEFLTGGKVRIIGVTTRESGVGPFSLTGVAPTLLVRCEQI